MPLYHYCVMKVYCVTKVNRDCATCDHRLPLNNEHPYTKISAHINRLSDRHNAKLKSAAEAFQSQPNHTIFNET